MIFVLPRIHIVNKENYDRCIRSDFDELSFSLWTSSSIRNYLNKGRMILEKLWLFVGKKLIKALSKENYILKRQLTNQIETYLSC